MQNQGAMWYGDIHSDIRNKSKIKINVILSLLTAAVDQNNI